MHEHCRDARLAMPEMDPNMESGTSESLSMQQKAASVCKYCMLGDREQLLRAIDEQPELMNHADDQVRRPDSP